MRLYFYYYYPFVLASALGQNGLRWVPLYIVVDPRPKGFLFLPGNFMSVYRRGTVGSGLFCVFYWLCLLIVM